MTLGGRADLHTPLTGATCGAPHMVHPAAVRTQGVAAMRAGAGGWEIALVVPMGFAL